MQNYGKIVIIGAGHVGSHCAMALAWRSVCSEIVLVDLDRKKAEAQALDVGDALSFLTANTEVRAGSYSDCSDADIVVIAIGEPRQPGQTRLDLLESSARMLNALIGELKQIEIRGIVVTITNPADIVADYVRRGLGMDRFRVFGTGTLLDTARLIRILSEETGAKRGEIRAFSLGEHGDSSMIPFSQVLIHGKPFESFAQLDKEVVLQRTRMSGMDIINGKNSTEFGIGQVLSLLCEGILRDEKMIFPLSVLLEGEYGQKEVHCGVPCRIGRNGIEEIVVLALSAEEQQQLNTSCEIIRKHIAMAQAAAPQNA
ncbi:L-lactate dehydrogenase [Anoxybacterium hadale]|uniref:L-lactate dehydrogenase n=1 Tax=Anoxybacterium hadale TaxID=3408580 RepID=A0ACD1AGZ1_9FIRM|nr:L-lactate dehydrogenase [Clostridiales bacterium]